MYRYIAGLLIELALLLWLIWTLVSWGWIVTVVVIGVPVATTVHNKNAARRVAERQRVARLVRRADEENRLVQDGLMAGVYGQYVPPPSMRGCGIWMWGDKLSAQFRFSEGNMTADG